MDRTSLTKWVGLLICFWGISIKDLAQSPTNIVLSAPQACIGTEFDVEANAPEAGFYVWTISPPGYFPFGPSNTPYTTIQCDVPISSLNLQCEFFSPISWVFNTIIYDTIYFHHIPHAISPSGAISLDCSVSRDTVQIIIEKDTSLSSPIWTTAISTSPSSTTIVQTGTGIAEDTIWVATHLPFNLHYTIHDSTCSLPTDHWVAIDSVLPLSQFTFSQLGSVVQFNSSGTSSQGYQWQMGDGTTSTLEHPSHTYATNGYFQACLIAQQPGCGADTSCQWINIGCQPPSANVIITPNSPDIQYQFTGSMGPSTQLILNFGDGTVLNHLGTGQHTYSAPGNYTFSLILFDSCGADTFNAIIPFGCNPPVTAQFGVTQSLLGAVFTDSSYSLFSPQFLWDFGDGNASTHQNPSHIYATAGNYTVCHQVQDLCGNDTLCQIITISCPIPVASFNSTISGMQVQFQNNSTSNFPQFFWDFGDGTTSTAASPTHTYSLFGTYSAILIVTDSCGADTLQQSVIITCTPPIASFTHTNWNYQITATSNSTTVGPTSYFWDFGDGNNDTLPNTTHIYSTAGTYTLSLIVTNLCGADTSYYTYTVPCTPTVAYFSFTKSQLTVNFTNGSSTNPGYYYIWDFGDGNSSSLFSPSHTYALPGTYLVSLTAIDSCNYNIYPLNVTVTCLPPVAQFQTSFNGLSLTTTNLSTGGGIASYTWDFGDGNSSNSFAPTHTYASPGTYTISLISNHFCGADTTSQQVTIPCSQPVAAFSSTSSFYQVYFSNASSGASSLSYQWDFGDGNSSTIAQPTHIYASNGNYTVCLIVQDYCQSDTLCQTVTVNCQSSITPNMTPQGGLNCAFSYSSATPLTNFRWHFGDGATSQIQFTNHTYTSPGTYTACITANTPCGPDTACITFTLTCTPPVADFTYTNNYNQFTFTSTSTGDINSYAWGIATGFTSPDTFSTIQSTYFYPGNYLACLRVEGDCGINLFCDSIEVICRDIQPYFTVVDSGLRIDINSSVTPAFPSYSHRWNFGDGTSLNGVIPYYIFSQPGTYQVCYKVWDQCATGEYCDSVTVNPSVGLAEIVSGDFRIWPNPMVDYFRISRPIIRHEPWHLILWSPDSKKAGEWMEATPLPELLIQLPNIPSGLYFLEILGSAAPTMVPLLKQ